MEIVRDYTRYVRFSEIGELLEGPTDYMFWEWKSLNNLTDNMLLNGWQGALEGDFGWIPVVEEYPEPLSDSHFEEHDIVLINGVATQTYTQKISRYPEPDNEVGVYYIPTEEWKQVSAQVQERVFQPVEYTLDEAKQITIDTVKVLAEQEIFDQYPLHTQMNILAGVLPTSGVQYKGTVEEMRTFIRNVLDRFWMLEAEIANSTTVPEVLAVKWSE